MELRMQRNYAKQPMSKANISEDILNAPFHPQAVITQTPKELQASASDREAVEFNDLRIINNAGVCKVVFLDDIPAEAGASDTDTAKRKKNFMSLIKPGKEGAKIGESIIIEIPKYELLLNAIKEARSPEAYRLKDFVNEDTSDLALDIATLSGLEQTYKGLTSILPPNDESVVAVRKRVRTLKESIKAKELKSKVREQRFLNMSIKDALDRQLTTNAIHSVTMGNLPGPPRSEEEIYTSVLTRLQSAFDLVPKT